jgi:pimeloyl-ACP methyl ester carboxylesterase
MAACLALWAVASPPARADVTCSARHPRASLVLFHPGGFGGLSAAWLRVACRDFARLGFRAVSVEYPLGNYRRAVAFARRAVRRGSFAVGWSAGGTLAAQVALEHRVRGAAIVSAPVDFTAYGTIGDWLALGVAPAQRVSLSPLFEPAPDPVPMLAMYSRGDRVVTYAQGLRFARRVHAMFRPIAGCHLCSLLRGHTDTARIASWISARIQRRAGTRVTVTRP